MRKKIGFLWAAVAMVCLGAALWAGASEIDEQLMARRRVFPTIGPGLRALRRAANGNYYILASPSAGVVIYDEKGKQIGVIGAPAEGSAVSKGDQPTIAFGEDCDVDAQGNVYVADRGNNLVRVFSPDGKALRSFPVASPISVAALPDGEVAVTTTRQSHLVVVFGPSGKVVREFGDPESLSSRPDLDRYANLGRVASDPRGHIYYGFTYMPEPLVRRYDRFGYAGQSFEFTGLDAFPEAQATRKEIERQESRNTPPSLRPILTAFGMDPVSGDVWMGLHNTLIHFDKDGIRRSEYQIYTTSGARVEANVILVEEERLLIGADPLGIYEFPRPDRKH
jgi:hypothetical protein